jgi:hypothetical protein
VRDLTDVPDGGFAGVFGAGIACFEGNTLAISGKGHITANERKTQDDGVCELVSKHLYSPLQDVRQTCSTRALSCWPQASLLPRRQLLAVRGIK